MIVNDSYFDRNLSRYRFFVMEKDCHLDLIVKIIKSNMIVNDSYFDEICLRDIFRFGIGSHMGRTLLYVSYLSQNTTAH